MSRQLRNRCFHLLRMGAGGHVEILGLPAQQEIAHATAHEVCLVAGILQPVQDLEGVLGDVSPRNVMVSAGEDERSDNGRFL